MFMQIDRLVVLNFHLSIIKFKERQARLQWSIFWSKFVFFRGIVKLMCTVNLKQR